MNMKLEEEERLSRITKEGLEESSEEFDSAYTEQMNEIIEKVRQALEVSDHDISNVPNTLIKLNQDNGWRDRLRNGNQRIRFDSFKEFISEPGPEGIGSSLDTLREVCEDSPDALDLIDQALSAYGDFLASDDKKVLTERNDYVGELQRGLRWYEWRRKKFSRCVLSIIQSGVWKERRNRLDRWSCFDTFQDFVQDRTGGGLESTVEKLRSFCQHDPEALAAIDSVMGEGVTSSSDEFPEESPTRTKVAAIRDCDVRHRKEYERFVMKDGDPAVSELIKLWHEWNEEFFDGAFQACPIILLAEPSTPSRLGDYSVRSGHGCRSQVRIRPSLLAGTHPHVKPGPEYREGRLRFVVDVCLHETIHLWQDEIMGDLEPNYHGHGPLFRDKCNEIGVKLGLPPVRTCKKRGKDKDLPSCSHFPHNVRPPGYYDGAYVRRSEKPGSLRGRLERLLRDFSAQEIMEELKTLEVMERCHH